MDYLQGPSYFLKKIVLSLCMVFIFFFNSRKAKVRRMFMDVIHTGEWCFGCQSCSSALGTITLGEEGEPYSADFI